MAIRRSCRSVPTAQDLWRTGCMVHVERFLVTFICSWMGLSCFFHKNILVVTSFVLKNNECRGWQNTHLTYNFFCPIPESAMLGPRFRLGLLLRVFVFGQRLLRGLLLGVVVFGQCLRGLLPIGVFVFRGRLALGLLLRVFAFGQRLARGGQGGRGEGRGGEGRSTASHCCAASLDAGKSYI